MRAAGRGGKPVTIKDIAKKANVSYATVSRALSGSQSIRSETRQRILEICEETGYTVNSVARSMVLRETRLLGLILPNIDNPYMSELAYHIERTARSRDYSIMLFNSAHDLKAEEQAFTLLLGRQVDGIMIFPARRESYQNIKKYLRKVPTVFVNENLQDKPESYVTVDNYLGARLGTEYLLELGHRQLLYFGRYQNSVTHILRARGFEETCIKNGITPQFLENTYNDTSIQIGYELAKELFEKPLEFTAMLAAADTLALGVMQAADELGLRIPQDFSLLGYDNIRYSELPKINLSTIEQPKRAIASVAVEMLLEKIQNDYEGYSHRILAPTLIKRSSCQPLDA